MFRATPPQGYAACCAAIRDLDLRDSIGAIANPVLIIVGKSDHATPPTMGSLIADHISGARILALEAAHMSNIEASNAFNRALLSFLSVQDRKPAARSEAEAAQIPAKAGRARKPVGTKSAAAKKSAVNKSATKKSAPKKASRKKTSAKAKPAKKGAAVKSAKKTALALQLPFFDMGALRFGLVSPTP